jgi:hypothetical protein
MSDYSPKSVAGIAGAGVGGIGGYMLAEQLAGPMIREKQKAFAAAAKEFAAVKSIPLMAGAVGALLVSTMVASHLKAKHRRELMSQQYQQANQFVQPAQIPNAAVSTYQ